MQIAYKLFSCGVPLYVGKAPEVPPPPALLSEQEFLRLLGAHPAVELLTRRQSAGYELLALPTLEWRQVLGLEPGPTQATPAPPRLELVPLPAGGSVLLPARDLPWTPASPGEHRSSLSPRLPVLESTLPGSAAGTEYDPAVDRQAAELCGGDRSLSTLLEEVRELETRAGVAVSPLPSSDLWLDLLRCAGPPPPLEGDWERLVVALLPGLRFLARRFFRAEEVSNAMAAFVLWLGALGELKITDGHGDDLFRLAEFGLPVVRALVHAEGMPSETLGDRSEATGGAFKPIPGVPLGIAFLEQTRTLRSGTLLLLRALGEDLGASA